MMDRLKRIVVRRLVERFDVEIAMVVVTVLIAAVWVFVQIPEARFP